MVQVLLSTFNGEKYLRPLLDSVLAQDCDVQLLVRDDGSSDSTNAILHDYAVTSSKIVILSGANVGVVQSFWQLLEHSSNTESHLAFCDQDDVWQKDKLSRAIEWLQRCTPERPAMYCSRVVMVDEDLRFLRLSGMPRRGLSFRNALVESVIWGCTIVINDAARKLLLREKPRHAWVHDRWIYMVVSAFGTVLFDEEARMLNRRHTKNTSKVPLTVIQAWRRQLSRLMRPSRRRTVRLAEEFQRVYGADLSLEKRAILDRFLNSRNRLRDRLIYAISCDVYHQSRLGNLWLKVLIALDRLS